MNYSSPNNSNVVADIVFGNSFEEKIMNIQSIGCHPVCPTNSHLRLVNSVCTQQLRLLTD